MWFEADTDVTIPVDYLVDGEFVVPDSATYAVRAHDGTLLTSGSMPATSTSESLSIAAAYTGIVAPWENRYVKLEFVLGTTTYHKVVIFKLSDFLPIAVEPDTARAMIGLSTRELPDRHIDLNAAYFFLVDTYGSSITDALTETGARNAAVNEAIAIQAALNTMSSLPLRALLTVRTEDSSAARSKLIDFDSIKMSLTQRLGSLIDIARGTSEVTQIIFDFSTPADAVTG